MALDIAVLPTFALPPSRAGLLIVGGAGLSDDQGRAHFSLWCMLASKLLISVDPRTFSAATIETLTNAEAIAVDQVSCSGSVFDVTNRDGR